MQLLGRREIMNSSPVSLSFSLDLGMEEMKGRKRTANPERREGLGFCAVK